MRLAIPHHKKQTAIVYYGCTCHYLMITAPVTTKQVTNAPIQVRLPDGASIESSHTCDLDFPHLPAATRKAHIILGLETSLLLSVGQLVDSNCSVVFDKVKFEVLHNNNKVLEGQMNFKNRLKTV
jgi:hypothetical protein